MWMLLNRPEFGKGLGKSGIGVETECHEDQRPASCGNYGRKGPGRGLEVGASAGRDAQTIPWHYMWDLEQIWGVHEDA